MGVDLLAENADDRIARMGEDDPATSISPSSAFANFGPATVQGIIGGLASVSRASFDAADTAQAYYGASAGGMSLAPIPMALRAYGMATDTYEQVSGQKIRDQIKEVQEWSKIDPTKTGSVSQIATAVSRGATIYMAGALVGGPLGGAGLLTGTEGYQTYNDMRDEGVDPYTATGLGALVGVTSGVGALLPASIGAKSLVGMMASGAAINATAGVVQRGWMSTILDANGYKDMAERYKMLDAEMLAADVVLGAAFGGIARFLDGKEKPGEKPPEPTLEQVEIALDTVRRAAEVRGAAGIPATPEAAALNENLQQRAVASLILGKPVDISAAEARVIADNSIVDPVKIENARMFREAMDELYGEYLEVNEPANVIEEPVVAPEVRPEAPPAPEQAETFKNLDPVTLEQISELSKTPDLDVQMWDGTIVKASALRERIAQDLAAAEKDSKLFDVAVACFLETD